jgi:hypothetical protein
MFNEIENMSVDLMRNSFIFILRNICISTKNKCINDVHILVNEMQKYIHVYDCFEDEIKLFCVVLLRIGYYKNEMFDVALDIVGLFKNFFDLFGLYDIAYEYRDYNDIKNLQYFGSVEIDV